MKLASFSAALAAISLFACAVSLSAAQPDSKTIKRSSAAAAKSAGLDGWDDILDDKKPGGATPAPEETKKAPAKRDEPLELPPPSEPSKPQPQTSLLPPPPPTPIPEPAPAAPQPSQASTTPPVPAPGKPEPQPQPAPQIASKDAQPEKPEAPKEQPKPAAGGAGGETPKTEAASTQSKAPAPAAKESIVGKVTKVISGMIIVTKKGSQVEAGVQSDNNGYLKIPDEAVPNFIQFGGKSKKIVCVLTTDGKLIPQKVAGKSSKGDEKDDKEKKK